MYGVWLKHTGEDPYQLNQLDMDTINDVENKLKWKLPQAYKDLILEQNGGLINYHSVYTEESGKEDVLGIDHIYGIGSPGILDSSYFIKEWDLPAHLLIFSGDGNVWFALDYSTPTPSVIHIETDAGKVTKIASSFGEFLNSLTDKEVSLEAERDDWTQEEAEAIFSGGNDVQIEEALLSMAYTNDVGWYVQQLHRFSDHRTLFIREAVVNILHDHARYWLMEMDERIHPAVEEGLKDLLVTLSRDENEGIRSEIEDIKANLEVG